MPMQPLTPQTYEILRKDYENQRKGLRDTDATAYWYNAQPVRRSSVLNDF